MFDPNFCGCLWYEGAERVQWIPGQLQCGKRCASWDQPLPVGLLDELSRNSRCEHEAALQRASEATAPSTVASGPRLDDGWSQMHMGLLWHRDLDRNHKNTIATASKAIVLPCKSGQKCLPVHSQTQIYLQLDEDFVLRSMSPGWFCIVDPDT